MLLHCCLLITKRMDTISNLLISLTPIPVAFCVNRLFSKVIHRPIQTLKNRFCRNFPSIHLPLFVLVEGTVAQVDSTCPTFTTKRIVPTNVIISTSTSTNTFHSFNAFGTATQDHIVGWTSGQSWF